MAVDRRDILSRFSVVKVGVLMIVLCFAVFFANFTLVEAISDKIFDINFKFRGKIDTPKDVVIIAIDQKSQEVFGRWPWSREVLVRLVDKLSLYGPRTIGLDIVFSYPEQRPDLALSKMIMGALPEKGNGIDEIRELLIKAREKADVDARFAESLARAGNTVPGYFFFTTKDEIEDLDLDNESDYMIIRKSRYTKLKYPPGGKKDFVLKEGVGVKPNIKPLTDAAAYTGYFNIFPDTDGVIRRFVNVVQFNGKYFPSAVIQMLRVYFGDENVEVRFEDFGVSGITVGPRDIPTDEYGQTLINYYGPEDMFAKISIADILSGEIPDEELKRAIGGKIAVIGATATGIYDIRHTPFGSMPGVEVEANFMQNVIDGTMLRKAGWFFLFDAISMLALGIFITLFMRRSKLFGGAIVSVSLISAYVYFQRYMFSKELVQLSVTYPVLSIIFVYGGTAFYKYYVESRERQFIQGAFGQYLSPAVIKDIIKDPSKLSLGGVRKEMTVLFSDVAGFSTISEKLQPEELVQLLNEYLTEMSDIIMKNKGTVDKYEGDAIIAFFGAPLDDTDHAYNCVLSAYEMQLRLEEMRKEWVAKGKFPLRMRIGVNTGPMVVGNMGSKNRMNYTIMGDSVNLAARLEGANKGYGTETMMNQSTVTACADRFEFMELDTIRVVGKKEPTKVFELLSPKGEMDPARMKTVKSFGEGLARYKSREFAAAASIFEEILEKDQSFGPAKTYLERSREYLNCPPTREWDGVYSLTSK